MRRLRERANWSCEPKAGTRIGVGQPRRAGGRSAGLRHCSQLYDLISIPAIGIFLLVEILLIVVVLHFRERRLPPDYSPLQWHGNRRLEIVWTVVPLAIVLSIGAGERSSFDT